VYQDSNEDMIMDVNVNLKSDEMLFFRINAMYHNGITLTHALNYLGVTKWKYGELKQMFRNGNSAKATADLRVLFQIRYMLNAKIKLPHALEALGLTHWQYGLLRQKLQRYTAWLDTNTSSDDVRRYLQEFSSNNYKNILPRAA
jgi:putative AlgH/UPF0301 family transcriptional regulator